MSFGVKKLVVGKGKTISDEKAAQWVKRYYEIEIQDEHDIEIAKASAEGLVDEWLTGQDQAETWNASGIKSRALPNVPKKKIMNAILEHADFDRLGAKQFRDNQDRETWL